MSVLKVYAIPMRECQHRRCTLYRCESVSIEGVLFTYARVSVLKVYSISMREFSIEGVLFTYARVSVLKVYSISMRECQY